MNISKPALAIWVLLTVVAVLASHYLTRAALESDPPAQSASDPAEARRPLYWVAPMDPNYRRDGPGKSPMGMDLVPVYAEPEGERGIVRISPEVLNNLGVRTAPARRQPLAAVIRTVGYVQYDQDRLIHIHPRVEGWVEKLHVKASGDPVREGQALYELYSPELVNAQEELLLGLNRQNARLLGAAEDRLRALRLPEASIAALKKSREVSQTITFYSPQAGVVDKLNIREGFYVQPGTTLMSIGSLEDVWVEAEVFERQAALVEVGLPVTMNLEYLPGRQWRGQVDYIYPSLDEQTRTLRVRLRFANRDGVLQPNMFAQVLIHAAADSDSITVPREAVVRTGVQDRVVLALGEGRFKSVAVKLGRVGETRAEILRGLDAGDRVVTSAQFLLDSESSKSADFRRMAPLDDTPPAAVQRATASGLIDHLDSAARRATISRGPIAKWHRPAATVDFVFADELALEGLRAGQSVEFSFEIRDGEFVIVAMDAGTGEQEAADD